MSWLRKRRDNDLGARREPGRELFGRGSPGLLDDPREGLTQREAVGAGLVSLCHPSSISLLPGILKYISA